MNKQIARKLKYRVEETAKYLSQKDRPNNFGAEDFEVDYFQPLSERSAAAVYRKTSGKVALILFLWFGDMKGQCGQWRWFALAESHIYGFQFLPDILNQIEQANFPLNFGLEEITG